MTIEHSYIVIFLIWPSVIQVMAASERPPLRDHVLGCKFREPFFPAASSQQRSNEKNQDHKATVS
jgi:hypothetical protein